MTQHTTHMHTHTTHTHTNSYIHANLLGQMENAEGQFTFVVGSGYELKTSQYPQHQTDTVEDGSVLKAQREVHLIM